VQPYVRPVDAEPAGLEVGEQRRYLNFRLLRLRKCPPVSYRFHITTLGGFAGVSEVMDILDPSLVLRQA